MLPELQSLFDQYNQRREAFRNTNWLKRYLDGLTPTTAMRAVFRHPVTPTGRSGWRIFTWTPTFGKSTALGVSWGFKQFLLEVLSGFIYITLNTDIKA